MMTQFAATRPGSSVSADGIEKRPLQHYFGPAKPSLVGLSRVALAKVLGGVGVAQPQQRMRVQQIWQWLYVRGAKTFQEMTTLPTHLRAALAEHFTLARPIVVSEQISVDGTRKWLLQLPGELDGRAHEVECVYIPEAGRGTLCISSQVGCTLNCSFCHTGTQRLVRNLTAGEIVGQVVLARDRLADWTPLNELPPPGKREAQAADGDSASGPMTSGPTASRSDLRRAGGGHPRLISNIVVMGMGEPLYNFEAVRDGLVIAADGEGLSLSKRRITLSTSGVVPNIGRVGTEIGVMLAVSLHAVTDAVRNELVPINRKYPLRELLAACRNYPGLSNARRITFEYVMLKGVNDSLAEARALVRLLKGIPAKINLIPFNPWPATKYECSDWEQIEKFSEIVFNAGYASPVRTPRGRDILAACGQLKSATEKLSARERLTLRAMALTD